MHQRFEALVELPSCRRGGPGPVAWANPATCGPLAVIDATLANLPDIDRRPQLAYQAYQIGGYRRMNVAAPM